MQASAARLVVLRPGRPRRPVPSVAVVVGASDLVVADGTVAMNGPVIIANDLPYTRQRRDWHSALEDVVAFSARDWAEDRDTAFVYAIVFGWGGDDDDPDTDAWDEVAAAHGWTPELVADLKRLHAEFEGAGHE